MTIDGDVMGERIEKLVRERSAALDEIAGTEGWRVLIQTLRDLEVGTMREAFEQRASTERWDYYAGMREGILGILRALQAIVTEGQALRERDEAEDEDERLTADDLGLTFGQGSLS